MNNEIRYDVFYFQNYFSKVSIDFISFIDILEIEREIQELQQMPDQSEEEVHQYQNEKKSLEKKQAGMIYKR